MHSSESRGERVGIISFALSPSESPGARSGGWSFRWISTIDGGAYGIQAGWEDKRADLFIQLFHRSNFTERGAGVNGFGESLKPVLALLVYMPAGREGG